MRWPRCPDTTSQAASETSSRPGEDRRTYHRRSDRLRGREQGWNTASRPFPEEEPAVNDLGGADLLAWALVDLGSSRGAMVGDTGIEPVTSPV